MDWPPSPVSENENNISGASTGEYNNPHIWSSMPVLAAAVILLMVLLGLVWRNRSRFSRSRYKPLPTKKTVLDGGNQTSETGGSQPAGCFVQTGSRPVPQREMRCFNLEEVSLLKASCDQPLETDKEDNAYGSFT